MGECVKFCMYAQGVINIFMRHWWCPIPYFPSNITIFQSLKNSWKWYWILFILSYIYIILDPEDPEYIRQMRRPAEVKEDINQMEKRNRVSAIMNSQAFREELEQLVHEQIKGGPYPTSLLALQQFSDFFLPQYRFNQGSRGKNNIKELYLGTVHFILIFSFFWWGS